MILEDYLKESDLAQARIRYNLFGQIIDSPADTDFPGLNSVSKQVLKELLIQPLATSWWVSRNMKNKYGVPLDAKQLIQIYENIQYNKLAQDMIRFNSAGGKSIAVARGITLKPKTTTYYFDIQTTDACPCKCTKCWNCYRDESGKKKLLKRTVTRANTPGIEDFKRVAKEAIDLGIEQLTSTGGGEPFTNRNLPDLLSYAKQYSRDTGRNLKIFVPSCGLGAVYDDESLLKKAVENIDLLRFSFDSLQKEFLMDSHGINERQYSKMMENFRKVVDLKKRYGLDVDLEILILIYGGNSSSIDYTLAQAQKLGATRILFNSITGKGEDLRVEKAELKQASEKLNEVFEKYSRGEYGNLKMDFDPVLMTNLDAFLQRDLDNLEPTIGDLRYCMKNVFGLTPVVTADGTFHVCFPCSQPVLANVSDIFKIGNIMDTSVAGLVEKMRAQYRDINPKKDCIKDCRDIPYFNGILRKVIDDSLLGISPESQPYLDRTSRADAFISTMHNEQFNASDLEKVMGEYESVCKMVRADQIKDFRQFVQSRVKDVRSFEDMREGLTCELVSRYDINLFSVGCIRSGQQVMIFSPELKQHLSYTISKGKLEETAKDSFESFVDRLNSNDSLFFDYDIPITGRTPALS